MRTFRLKALILLAFVLGSFPIRAAVPEAPQRLQFAWIFGGWPNTDEALLRWDAVPGATSYNVYRYDTNAAAWTLLASSVPVPRYRDPVFDLYEYTVTAVNDDGESAPAEPVVGDYGNGPWLIYVDPTSWPRYETAIEIFVSLNDVNGGDAM